MGLNICCCVEVMKGKTQEAATAKTDKLFNSMGKECCLRTLI